MTTIESCNHLLDDKRVSGVGMTEPEDIIEMMHSSDGKPKVESIADNEMIFYIYFQDMVNLRGIRLHSSSPCQVRMFPFNMNLGFDFSLATTPAKHTFYTTGENDFASIFVDNIDYFTLHLQGQKGDQNDDFSISRLVFYGNRNIYNTRQTDGILLDNWVKNRGCLTDTQSIGLSQRSDAPAQA